MKTSAEKFVGTGGKVYFVYLNDDNYNVYLTKTGKLNARCRGGVVTFVKTK